MRSITRRRKNPRLAVVKVRAAVSNSVLLRREWRWPLASLLRRFFFQSHIGTSHTSGIYLRLATRPSWYQKLGYFPFSNCWYFDRLLLKILRLLIGRGSPDYDAQEASCEDYDL